MNAIIINLNAVVIPHTEHTAGTIYFEIMLRLRKIKRRGVGLMKHPIHDDDSQCDLTYKYFEKIFVFVSLK